MKYFNSNVPRGTIKVQKLGNQYTTEGNKRKVNKLKALPMLRL